MRETRNYKQNINDTTLILFSLFMILFTLNLTKNGIVNSIGFISIISWLLFCFFYYYTQTLKNYKIYRIDLTIIIYASLYFMILIINSIKYPTYRSLINTVEFAFLVTFILTFSNLNYDNINKIDKFFSASIIMFFLMSFVFYFRDKNTIQSSIFANSNTLGIIAMALFGISLILYEMTRDKKFRFYSYIFVLQTILSKSRSSIGGIFIFAIVYFIYGKISKSKKRWNLFFILLIFSFMVLPIVYINLENYSFYPELYLLIYKYTGKTLLSGRQIIWSQLLSLVNNRPFLGYGTGALISSYTGLNLSAHNLFLQILFQNGIIGLFTFFGFLLIIWNFLYSKINNKLSRIVSSLFCGILFINLFEVTLIQNNMAAAILQWFIVTIGLNRTKSDIMRLY